MKKNFWLGIPVLMMIGVYAWISDAPPAAALSNPLTEGSNIAVRAPNNFPMAIPAAGTNCAVTIMVDFTPKDGGATPTTPVCSGYNTAATPLTKWNCAMHVCTDPAHCHSTWVVRDAAPGALSILAVDSPTDAGAPVRIERSAGCDEP